MGFFRAIVAATLAALFAAVAVNAASVPIFVGPGQSGGTVAIRPDLIPDLNALVNQINSLITPQSMATYQNFRNVLDNGEMTVNQRTNSGSAPTGISNTATYWNDRWAVFGGSSSSAQISQTNSGSTPAVSAPFQNGMRVQRGSGNTNVGQICAVQEIPAKDSLQLAGQSVTFSAYIAAGSNFSPTGSNVIMAIVSGAVADQGLSTLISGWSSAANAVSQNVAITSSYARYSVSGTLPTAAQEVAVEICMVPVGTAGTNDFFDFTGAQLEQGGAASQYEHKPFFIEQQKAYNYFYLLQEPAANAVIGGGMVTLTNNERITIPLPVPMRAVPTATCSIAPSMKLNIAGVVTSFTNVATATQSKTTGELSAGQTATAGQAILLQGNGGSDACQWSADF